jgi:MFS family permease
MASELAQRVTENPAASARMGAKAVIALIAAAMFFDATFYALIAPLLPHYSDRLGLDHLEVALLFAAQPAGAAVLALPAARLVKAAGAARTTTIGLVSLGFAAIVFALADSLAVLVACRFVQGASAALVWCGGLARLQALVAPERRGAAFGLAGSAAGAGSLGGPAFAALSTLVTIEWTLIALGALTFGLAVALYSFGELPREREAREGDVATDAPAGGRGLLPAALLRPSGVILISGIVLGAVSTVAPLRLADLGAGVVLIAAAFVLSALGEILVSPAAGHLSDRVGRMLPIRIVLAAVAPLLILVGLSGSVWITAPAMALSVCVVAALWPLGTALLSDRAALMRRSPADVFAVSVLAWSVGLGVGSLLFGSVAGLIGDGAGLAILAAPCLLALVLLRGDAPSDEVSGLRCLDPQIVSPSI